MSISGIGLKSSYLTSSLLNVRSQLEDLQQQLSTGKISTTYAGLGAGRGVAVSLRAQISSMSAYADTITNVNTRINVASTALSRMSKIGDEVKGSVLSASNLTLDNSGQTASQKAAQSSLAEMLQLLNVRAGDRYLFSGRTIDKAPVASSSDILDGAGGKAGLKQVIAERRQADLGADGMGRLAVAAPTTTSVSLSEDVAGSPFGLKLTAVSSSLTGATATGPAGSPPSISVDLGAVNPNDGEKVSFNFTLPDGSSETIELTATTKSPAPSGSFTIGTTSADTATNLKTALTSAVSSLANGALVAASAMTASNNFFGSPPMRVGSSPASSATTLVDGSATTVQWYTGEDGVDPARGTAVARVDDSITVQYGARANEQALRWQLQNVAVYAAVTTSTTDPNATAQVTALNQRVAKNLATQSGQQSIEEMQADLAGAQSAMKAAGDRQTQMKSTAGAMLDSIEGVNDEEVITKILALQTNLQASYQTTAMLYQTTLLNYL